MSEMVLQTNERLVQRQVELWRDSMGAAAKRWAHLGQFELEVARNKSYNYLSRRGFSYPAARAAFEKLVNRQKEV